MDDKGVSPVVAVLLLLNVFIGIYAIYMSVTVPGEFASKEKEHMLDVRESFFKLQRAVQEMSASEARSISVPMSADLTSGIFRGPSIGGRVTAREGTLRFELKNAYYLPQIYAYENGAVILVQLTDNRSMMVSRPTMVSVVPYGSGDNVKVCLQSIQLIGSGEITSTGIETFTVLVENSWQTPIPEEPNMENVTIVINSNYQDAWRDYLVELVEQLHENGIHATVDVQNLQLTIHGKITTTGVNDIYLVREFKDISITIS